MASDNCQMSCEALLIFLLARCLESVWATVYNTRPVSGTGSDSNSSLKLGLPGFNLCSRECSLSNGEQSVKPAILTELSLLQLQLHPAQQQ